MPFDITKNLRKALTDIYTGGPTDMTTLWARRVAQDRQQSTTDASLYDGDDIQEEARNYLRDLTTV